MATGHLLYEEWLRAVVEPPWVVVARLGYRYVFARKRASLGVLAEALWPGDRDSYLVRIGPAASWAFSPRFDLGLVLTTPVYGPDSLGLYPGLWGAVRARYRVASR